MNRTLALTLACCACNGTATDTAPSPSPRLDFVPLAGGAMTGPLVLNAGLSIPHGASPGYVLTSDGSGSASWGPLSSSAGGDITAVQTVAPLVGGGTSGELTVSLPAATAAGDGYLKAADWARFDSKAPADHDHSKVKPANVKGDGVSDDTAAIQAALDAAQPGDTVFLPTGRYLIGGTLTVRAYTTLQGTYVGPGNRTGTTLLATGGAGTATGNGVVVLAFGISALRNMRIEYPNQAKVAPPVVYPYAITGLHSARVEEIYLHNAYQGINFDEAHDNLIRNVWGNPLKTGVRIDHGYGLARMENVHFWPYYTVATALPDSSLQTWVQNNGTSFEFGRSDWQRVKDIFSFGYAVGAHFYATADLPGQPGTQGPMYGQLENVGFDSVGKGIDVEDVWSLGVNFTNAQIAPIGTPTARAISIHPSNTGAITFVNSSFHVSKHVVAELGAGSLTLQGCTIYGWAMGDATLPAFVVGSGTLNVQGNTLTNTANTYLALLYGASSRASFVGNVVTSGATLTITSTIGTRLVKGLNNPEFTP